mgnify:CR=1 FL=1
MTEENFYWALLYSYIGLAILTAVSLLFIAAPYGRHSRGLKPQYLAKSRNTGFHTISPRSSVQRAALRTSGAS